MPDLMESLKRQHENPGLTLNDVGRMNRSLRPYFGLRLKDQADALGISSAKLSAYELGRAPLPEGMLAQIHIFWIERFAERVDGYAGQVSTNA